MSEKKPTYKELQDERDAYKAENDALKRDRVNRQAKNSVFLNLFMRKEYQLKLYKELFPADTTITEDDLELVTLDNVLTNRAEVEKIMMTMLSPEYVKMASERTEKIKEDISLAHFMGIAEDQIKAGIIKRYDLTPTYAQNFLDDDTDPDDCRSWAL